MYRRVYDEPSATARDPRLAEFLTDMLTPYQVQFRPDLLAEGTGHSFGEMGEPLIAEMASEHDPVDLLVLAFAMHDLRPGQATSTYLSHLCPGNPLAFSVCDQGDAGGFTALRLIQTYTRTGDFAHSLLLVMEQTALYYEPDRPAARPQRHAAVAIRFDAGGQGQLAPVRQQSAVPADQVADRLRAELAALTAGRDDVTLIAGEGLASQLTSRSDQVDELVLAPAGQPATGTWWALAGDLDRWAGQQRLVLVADYEPTLGYLSICAVDFAEQPAAAEPVGAGRRSAAR
ncbi:MAG: 2-hydroxy-acid oxidase [Jatrophihabitantaceae bacterium]